MPGSSSSPSSLLTEGERSLYCLQSVRCGFSLLDEIIITAKSHPHHYLKADVRGVFVGVTPSIESLSSCVL